ncbi:MAG TPA: ABC transporter permease [Actinomycetota bacterium]|jgi:ABC-2 type transport system permease protein|nr:ABC transporter permease [Actinomycetota bacterium]
MTTTAVQTRPALHSTPSVAFVALLLRDFAVLRKNIVEFIIRSVMQPLLFVFVFTYVFPKIGFGVGGSGAGETTFSSLLVPGVVAIACMFQGVQSVALPLVTEFGFTREIEDRVMAPLSISGVAMEKIVAGALQGIFAAVVVFPMAAFIPATAVHLDVQWFELLTLLPLTAFTGAALGLVMGTRVDPRRVPLLFGIVVIPMTFLGATYYPWALLHGILWLQILVLINPLVYMSEAMRIALTPQLVPHMQVWVVYVALIGFSILLAWIGIRGFRQRVLT